jgi:hypothetical protein
MRPGIARALLLLAIVAGLQACGGGSGGSPAANAIGAAVQDLSLDPEGATTVLSFASVRGLATASAASFEADGGQTALSAVVAGSDVTVTWSGRVTPSHRVRAVGLLGVSSAFHAVSTSDASAPTFAVGSATQNPGLGGDTIRLDFAGPHVVESEVEDLSSWSLATDGQALDLAGSTFVFDPSSQRVDVTLGTNANLHATFTISASGLHSVADVLVSAAPVGGNATGDATPPGLVSANQNLAEDEYGRVVDFTFDEAMDPVFSTALGHFSAAPPDIATNVEQPAENVLRVSFNNPIVPGVDLVTLTGVVDLHGNPFPDGPQPIAQPSPVANAFAAPAAAVSVENAGGDYVSATTTQALDPDSALLPASWSLSIAGTPVDLAQQGISYDLLAKTLRIDLAFDLVNGQSFTLQGVAARDVDGEIFGLSDTQTVSGDAVAPTVVAAIQDRTVDPTGKTVDVQLSEDVDATTAEASTSFSSSGPQGLVSATLHPGTRVVTLVFDAPMIPGDATLSAQDVQDLAGNAMAPTFGIALVSTDTTPPSVVSFGGNANEGPDDDVIELVFDDDVIPSEIQDLARWSVESPVGTPRPTAGATVLFDASVRRARLKFLNGENLRRDDDFGVTVTGVRDLGGNALAAVAHVGQVLSETTLPSVATVFRPSADPTALEVRFSEPCDRLEDLYDVATNPTGTRYVLRDSGGAFRAYAVAAASVDQGLGARVSFGVAVAPTDTIDVMGATDLPGNPLFPALAVATVAEDLSAPDLAPGLSAFQIVSGEDNDSILVRFDRPMSPWTITDSVHYTPSGPTAIRKRTRDVLFDGVDTVTLPIQGNTFAYDLLAGAPYGLEVAGLSSAQGVPFPGPVTESGILASGDATPPTVAAGSVRIDPSHADSLLVEFSEAVGPPSATDVASYDYGPGSAPVSAALVSPRVVRLGFAVTPVVGQPLALDVADKAGNASGPIVLPVAAADAAGPLVVSVDGLVRPGYGGDEIHVDFDEPVSTATALLPVHYTLQSGGAARDLSGSTITYASAANRVTIRLAAGQDLAAAGPLVVGVNGVEDVAGNAVAAGLTVGGSTAGDATPPDFLSAFVNWRKDPAGTVVDVRFTEDVDAAFASDASSWSATGGPAIVSVSLRERNHFRVVLSAALPLAGTLQLSGLPDVAGNVSGAISIVPVP